MELKQYEYNENAPSGVTWRTGLILRVTSVFSYVLLHHMMGEGGWAYPEGGMGAVTQAMAAAAASCGAHIFTNVVR
jgi:phytoene dehydrogenase-like protein